MPASTSEAQERLRRVAFNALNRDRLNPTPPGTETAFITFSGQTSYEVLDMPAISTSYSLALILLQAQSSSFIFAKTDANSQLLYA